MTPIQNKDTKENQSTPTSPNKEGAKEQSHTKGNYIDAIRQNNNLKHKSIIMSIIISQ